MSQNKGVDLTNCDREPIHIPGSIQPHGCLLVCDASVRLVVRHSSNAAALLDLDPRKVNGVKLDELLGAQVMHDIRNALARSPEPARPGLMQGVKMGVDARPFDIAVHQYKGYTLVEFEPVAADDLEDSLAIARTWVGRLGKMADADELVQKGGRLLKALLGYDRVMVYQFARDGSGQVLSEAKHRDLESFAGQHFPASDIPQQARELYLKNTIRIISDVNADRIAIIPERDSSGEPVDLSFAHLRSVSPIHCEYLRNMGVAASMSISIIVDGALWGLISCHHYSPRSLTMARRVAAEMFGEFFSLHLEALNHKQKLTTAVVARRALDAMLKNAADYANVGELVKDKIQAFTALMPCDGIGVYVDGVWHDHGATPPAEALPGLIELIGAAADGKVWATHALSERLRSAADYRAQASGVLAIPLSQIPRDYLIFFRREILQSVRWAGNPEKLYEHGPLGERLTPRKSFAVWKEEVERQSQPWTESDREIAETTRIALVEVILRNSEILGIERRRADFHQELVNEELNHRVKNILSLIKSLVSHPVTAGRSLQDYVISLKGRIQALSFAHDQVVHGNGGGMLRDLLNAELSPYQSVAAVNLDGPHISLDAQAFSVLALVFHELATNAAKYGALSVAEGHLAVQWRLNEGGACQLRWKESGGPKVSAPTRQGFGSVLIHRGVPFDLGGESSVDYPSSGVVARLLIPAKFVGTSEPTVSDRTEPPEAKSIEPSLLAGAKILLVEDQLLIALDTEGMLLDHGAEIVELASSVAEASRILAGFSPDLAVLDVSLTVGTSLPVAEELLRRKIPFVFGTGYAENAMIPTSMCDVPVVRKPYDDKSLVVEAARIYRKVQPA